MRNRLDDVDVDGHRWHSGEYVAQWMREHGEETNVDQAKRYFSQLDRIVEVLRKEHGSPRSIMDLGAGWGRLARRLLDEFPNAEVVVHDFSAPMLAAARTELEAYGSRVSYFEADLDVDGVIASVGRRFDVIVTSQTLHHLRTERLAVLYRDIHAALATDGLFVNLDRVHRRAAALVVALERALYGHTAVAESVSACRLTRLRSWLRVRDEAATHGGTRAQHIRLLGAAGFRARGIALGNASLLVGRSSGRP